MVSFPSVSPPRPYTHPSPHPYAPHSQPISFFSILSPAQYWMRSTNHLAPLLSYYLDKFQFPIRKSSYRPTRAMFSASFQGIRALCPAYTPIQRCTASFVTVFPLLTPKYPPKHRFLIYIKISLQCCPLNTSTNNSKFNLILK